MTSIATLNGETVVRPFDLNHDEKPFSLSCTGCNGPVHLVKETITTHGVERKRHFSHDPGTLTESGPGGSGGCGGGEDDIHEERKGLALSQGLIELDKLDLNVDSYGIEGRTANPTKQIGGRRPDAYIEFSDRHARHGDGFCIEYQHKNVDKDIEQVSKDYREAYFTPVWLDKNQFNNGEIDFFGGDIRPCWPVHIPEQSSWPKSRFRIEANKWKKAKHRGLTTSSVPATLPPEWHLELWRSEPWGSRFKPSDVNRYVLHGLLCSPTQKNRVNAKLPEHILDTIAYTESDWESIFKNPKLPLRSNDQKPQNHQDVPLNYWIATEGPTNKLKAAMNKAFYNNATTFQISQHDKNTAMDRIPNLIKYNTSPAQPNAIDERTVVQIATNIGLNSNAVRWGLRKLVVEGELQQCDENTYKLA